MAFIMCERTLITIQVRKEKKTKKTPVTMTTAMAGNGVQCFVLVGALTASALNSGALSE